MRQCLVDEAFGADSAVCQEAVFLARTMDGVEPLTDHSYRGQIWVRAYSQFGNYGMHFPADRVP